MVQKRKKSYYWESLQCRLLVYKWDLCKISCSYITVTRAYCQEISVASVQQEIGPSCLRLLLAPHSTQCIFVLGQRQWSTPYSRAASWLWMLCHTLSLFLGVGCPEFFCICQNSMYFVAESNSIPNTIYPFGGSGEIQWSLPNSHGWSLRSLSNF